MGNRQFRWRFHPVKAKVTVIPLETSVPQLQIEWGWVDWCEPDGPGNDPCIVTPAFVALAIQHALNQGWNPEVNQPPIQLWYDGKSFIDKPKG